MSSWIGNVTPGSINLVRSGGDTRWGPLLASGAATAALVTFVAMFGDKIALVLTVVAVTILVLGFAYLAREVVADKLADRDERRWRLDVARQQALEASGPLHVTAERVRELEPAPLLDMRRRIVSGFVERENECGWACADEAEREAVPIELDALDR